MTYFPTIGSLHPTEGTPQDIVPLKRKGREIAKPDSTARSIVKKQKVEHSVKKIISPADIEVGKSMSEAKFYSKYDVKIFTGQELTSAEMEDLGQKLIRKYTQLSGKEGTENYTSERVLQIADSYVKEKTRQSLEGIKVKASKFDRKLVRTISPEKASPYQLKEILQKVEDLARDLERKGYKDDAAKVRQIYEDAIYGKPKQFPISRTTIEKGAHLNEIIRKARAFAHKHETLKGTDFESFNKVYQVGLKPPSAPKRRARMKFGTSRRKHRPAKTVAKADPGSLIAFFKTGAEDALSSAVMEKFMWDVANILGLERSFAATGNIDLSLRQPGASGTEPYINESGELKTVTELGSPMRGGIQPPIPGMMLLDYMELDEDKRPPIEKSELNHAVLITTVFGMFDAHGCNIFITPEGSPMFFDNARSLPHSNGIIFWGGRDMLQPSYRCALLNLPEAHNKLTQHERKELLKETRRIKEKLYDLRAFFDSPLTKHEIAKVPPGWVDPKLMVGAMEERIDALMANLTSSAELTLIDLAVRSNPGYQVVFAISFLASIKDNQTTTESNDTLSRLAENFHSSVGKTDVLKYFISLDEGGYDIGHILELATKSMKFDTFVKKLISYHKEMERKGPPAEKPRNYQAFSALCKGVNFDNKEVSHEVSTEFFRNEKLFDALAKKGYPYYPLNCSDPECLSVPEREFIVRGWSGNDVFLAYRTEYGLRFHPIRVSSTPGSIHIGEGKRRVPIEKAAGRIINAKDAVKIEDFPTYRSDLLKEELFRHGNKIEVFAADEGIVAFYQGPRGKIYRYDYALISEDEFSSPRGGASLTLEEVIEEIKSYTS